LWGLVVGVSDYMGEELDLRYAGKDAVAMAQALTLGAHRLFGAERVRLRVLTTEPVADAEVPTKANLEGALTAIAAWATATDILVVYLAGHGVVHGGVEGDFYYLTREARSGNLTDPEVRKQVALSSAELTDWIKRVPALKQVLILDTCGAGRVVEQLATQREVPSSQIRSLERVKDRMGMFVLAGSAADAVSYEASRYGHGLLTYTLLEGMRGGALREDEYVDVSQLFGYAVDRVPRLAEGVGGIQKPQQAMPRGGGSFDIGRLTGTDLSQIKLATPRPLVLRTQFQDADRFVDHLNLRQRVNAKLREVSVRSLHAPVVFVDAATAPQAYIVVGRYTPRGDELTLEVRLVKQDDEVAHWTMAGSVSKLDALISTMVEKVLASLQVPRPERSTRQ
jgi:hypothetical protein